MKNPFANLFKKKSKEQGNTPPVPQAADGKKKKEGFFDKFLKKRVDDINKNIIPFSIAKEKGNYFYKKKEDQLILL